MRIMLICNGGMSTGILMNKMAKYAQSNDIELEVKAFGVNEYLSDVDQYDVILLGPQISYKCDEVAQSCSLPVGSINPMDYAIGDVAAIIKLANSKLGEKI